MLVPYVVYKCLYLYSGWGVGVGVVITRFKAKSQFRFDWTGTELELSLAKIVSSQPEIYRLCVVCKLCKSQSSLWQCDNWLSRTRHAKRRILSRSWFLAVEIVHTIHLKNSLNQWLIIRFNLRLLHAGISWN